MLSSFLLTACCHSWCVVLLCGLSHLFQCPALFLHSLSRKVFLALTDSICTSGSCSGFRRLTCAVLFGSCRVMTQITDLYWFSTSTDYLSTVLISSVCVVERERKIREHGCVWEFPHVCMLIWAVVFYSLFWCICHISEAIVISLGKQ